MNILYVDLLIPDPKSDSGSVDAFNYMKCLAESGFQIEFLSYLYRENFFLHAKKLMEAGISVLSPVFNNPEIVDKWIFENGKKYDVVILSRPEVGGRLLVNGREWCKDSLLIYSTVDLHHIRLQRKAALSQNEEDFRKARQMLEIESAIFEISDKIVVVSEIESEYLRSIEFGQKTTVWPLLREIPGRLKSFEERQDVAFIGNFGHDPNIDGLTWFLENVWPLVLTRNPALRLQIIGSNMPEWIKNLSNDRVIVHGFVENLDTIFDNIRLTIAPLRYGAGLKGKIITSLSYGVPVISSPIGAEGMPKIPERSNGIEIGSSEEEFANGILAIYQSSDQWNAMSLGGLETVSVNFDYRKIREKIRNDIFLAKTSAEILSKLQGSINYFEKKLIDPNNGAVEKNIHTRDKSKELIEEILEVSNEFGANFTLNPIDFLHYANEISGAWIYDSAIASHALQTKNWDLALYYAERSLSKLQTNLFTQELWLKARDGKFSSNRETIYTEFLTDKHCERPDSWLEITEEATWICDPSWLPMPIGDGKSISNDLKSKERHKIQASIADGSFKFCSRLFCPAISSMDLKNKKEETGIKEIGHINLNHKTFFEPTTPNDWEGTSEKVQQANQYLRIHHTNQTGGTVRFNSAFSITGHGDPFQNPYLRHTIKELSQDRNLEIDLKTNEFTPNERTLSELGINSLRRVWISLDAATESIYNKINPNGDYIKTIKDIANLAKLKKTGKIAFIGLDFSVRTENIHQMKAFFYLGKALDVDKIRFSLSHNKIEYQSRKINITNPGFQSSPLNRQLNEITKDPIFLDPLVDLGNIPIFLENFAIVNLKTKSRDTLQI